MMIGIGLDARLGLPFDQLRAAAQEAARLGFESVWTPAGGVPDSFHVCAAWSHDTSLRTGISVVPAARMWTPLGLAAQAATLAQLSAGRFVLGLGTGGYGPGLLGIGGPARPPDRGDARVRHRGPRAAGRPAGHGRADHRQGRLGAGRARVAAVGLARGWGICRPLRCTWPRSARRCSGSPGEVADGALLNWATPERIAVSREQIDEGAARAGRDPGRSR